MAKKKVDELIENGDLNAAAEAFLAEAEADADDVEDIEDSVKNSDNTVYDLSGRKVQKAQKGMYIINGKKVAVN